MRGAGQECAYDSRTGRLFSERRQALLPRENRGLLPPPVMAALPGGRGMASVHLPVQSPPPRAVPGLDSSRKLSEI